MRDINIYGDINSYGEYLERPFEPDFIPAHDFKFEWPAGYWEEYDKLAIEAKRVCGADHVCIAVLLNGKFR